MKNDLHNDESHRAVDRLDELLRQARWPEASSDPLDELLGMAQWPEPVAEPASRWLQEARMPARRQWNRSSFRWQRARKIAGTLVGIAAAAGVLVAVVSWSLRFRAVQSPAGFSGGVAANLPQEFSRPNEAAAPEKPAEMVSPTTVLGGENDAVSPPDTPSHRLRLQMILARTEATWQSKEDELLDRTLAQRTIDPNGDLQQLVEPLMAGRAKYERLLLERIDRFAGAQQTAAIELLGCIGSEASVPQLVYLSHKPAAHAPAIRTLLEIADVRTLDWLARDEWDPGLQEEIMAALPNGAEEQSPVFALSNEGVGPCFEYGLQFQW